MNTTQDPFQKANYFFRRADYVKWHRQQSKQQILRSQVGFIETAPSRPKACQGCAHYHGVTYGTAYESRNLLICGFHPYGWGNQGTCPDWEGSF
uniref:hypothetical protein n=1 Tax=Trichocoleus desertorum TaxID=1481672 RepID=UPI0025B46199|nr:hypothetical protein [Trichocoleus desertorum]